MQQLKEETVKLVKCPECKRAFYIFREAKETQCSYCMKFVSFLTPSTLNQTNNT